MDCVCKGCGITFTFKNNLCRHVQNSCKSAKKTRVHSKVFVNYDTINKEIFTNNPMNNKEESQTIKEGYRKVGDRWQCLSCNTILHSNSKKDHTEYACRRKIYGPLKCVHCQESFCNNTKRRYHESKCSKKPNYTTTYTSQRTTTRIPSSVTNITNIDNSKTTTNNIIILNNHGDMISYDNVLTYLQTNYPTVAKNLIAHNEAATMIDLCHFNSDFPENQTIRKPNKKDKSVLVHRGNNEWDSMNGADAIGDVLENINKHVVPSITNDKQLTVSDMKYVQEHLYHSTNRNDKRNTNQLMSKYSKMSAETIRLDELQRVFDTYMKEEINFHGKAFEKMGVAAQIIILKTIKQKMLEQFEDNFIINTKTLQITMRSSNTY